MRARYEGHRSVSVSTHLAAVHDDDTQTRLELAEDDPNLRLRPPTEGAPCPHHTARWSGAAGPPRPLSARCDLSRHWRRTEPRLGVVLLRFGSAQAPAGRPVVVGELPQLAMAASMRGMAFLPCQRNSGKGSTIGGTGGRGARDFPGLRKAGPDLTGWPSIVVSQFREVGTYVERN